VTGTGPTCVGSRIAPDLDVASAAAANARGCGRPGDAGPSGESVGLGTGLGTVVTRLGALPSTRSLILRGLLVGRQIWLRITRV